MDNHSTPIVQLNNSSVNSIPTSNQQQMVPVTNDSQSTPIVNNTGERTETAVVNQILRELQTKDTSTTSTEVPQLPPQQTQHYVQQNSQQTPIMLPHPSHQPAPGVPSQPIQQQPVPVGYPQQPVQQVGAPLNTLQAPSVTQDGTSLTIYKQFINEFKNPLLVAAIFLVLNHSLVKNLITKNLPKLVVSGTGNYNLLGLIAVSLIGGILYYGTHRLLK